MDDDNDTFTDSINDIQEDGDGLEAQIPLQHHWNLFLMVPH